MTARARSALPEDLVRTVYFVGLERGALTLKDRLRGLCVCTALTKALSKLPIPTVHVEAVEEGRALCQWITVARPPIVEFYQESSLEVAALALHSLQREDLQKLRWGADALDVSRALPFTAIFPHLKHLEVDLSVRAADWLVGLTFLEDLATLELSLDSDDWPLAAGNAEVELPPLAHLTRLVLEVCNLTMVVVDLEVLPVLAQLVMSGDDGSAIVRAGEPAPQLQHLGCSLAVLSADFSVLAGLRSLAITSHTELDAGASLAAATALTRLRLAYSENHREEASALQLLQHLPRSVSCVALMGTFTPEVVARVSELQGLAALALDHHGTGVTPAPPAGAPVWRDLRAFSWAGRAEIGKGRKLPEALGHAHKLQALQVHIVRPSMRDLELITSPPSLRKLMLQARSKAADEPEGAAFRRLARKALPHVCVSESEVLYIERFYDWALTDK